MLNGHWSMIRYTVINTMLFSILLIITTEFVRSVCLSDNVLLILGNGFDLSCGLKSSYSNYYDYKCRENNNVAKLEKDCKQYLFPTHSIIYPHGSSVYYDFYHQEFHVYHSSLNTWEILLTFYSFNNGDLVLWRNVEEAIEFFISKAENITGRINKILNNKFDLDSTLTNWQHDLVTFILFITYVSKVTSMGKEKLDIHDWLMAELVSYEFYFADYIEKQSESAESDYSDRSLRLLNNILSDEININPGLKSTLRVTLLNFNYTSPSSSGLNHANIMSLNNIHGQCDNRNTIFGFDHTELEPNSPAYLFSKTSRLLESKMNGHGNNSFLLPEPCDRIIFFGHSLGIYDYSYFQALFDLYDIYGSKIKLIFKYSIFDSDRSKEIKKETHSNVVNLIARYGKSMDNADKGKNLMHKLLLENRLILAEI